MQKVTTINEQPDVDVGQVLIDTIVGLVGQGHEVQMVLEIPQQLPKSSNFLILSTPPAAKKPVEKRGA